MNKVIAIIMICLLGSTYSLAENWNGFIECEPGPGWKRCGKKSSCEFGAHLGGDYGIGFEAPLADKHTETYILLTGASNPGGYYNITQYYQKVIYKGVDTNSSPDTFFGDMVKPVNPVFVPLPDGVPGRSLEYKYPVVTNTKKYFDLQGYPRTMFDVVGKEIKYGDFTATVGQPMFYAWGEEFPMLGAIYFEVCNAKKLL